jgi:hypothetical protein
MDPRVKTRFKKTLTLILFFLTLIAFSLPESQAARNSSRKIKYRSENSTGLLTQVLAPGLVGMSIAHNFSDAFRWTVGGLTATSASMSANTYFLNSGVQIFAPKWRLSPFLGATLLAGKFRGRSSSSNIAQATFQAGFDYQSRGGFCAGASVGSKVYSIPILIGYLGLFF